MLLGGLRLTDSDGTNFGHVVGFTYRMTLGLPRKIPTQV